MLEFCDLDADSDFPYGTGPPGPQDGRSPRHRMDCLTRMHHGHYVTVMAGHVAVLRNETGSRAGGWLLLKERFEILLWCGKYGRGIASKRVYARMYACVYVFLSAGKFELEFGHVLLIGLIGTECGY